MDADGVVEVRTAPLSRVELASGVVVVLAAAGIAWLAFGPDDPPRPAPSPRQAVSAPPDAPEPPRALAGGMHASAATTSAGPAAGGPATAAHDRVPTITPPPEAATSAPAPAPGRRPRTAAPAPEPTSAPEPPPGGAEATGLAAFPPLGTKPIVSGVVVPEGFELPPGFVRHYQVTDDGRMLAPVLLYHPDHAPLDAEGRPLLGAKDRVVPPDQVPPGMPAEVLDPAPVEPHP